MCIFAVGILLVTFGGLTTFLAFKVESAADVLPCYLVIKSILCLGRVVLDLVYPGKVALFGIEPFTAVAMPGVILVGLLFAVSFVLLMTSRARADGGLDPENREPSL